MKKHGEDDIVEYIAGCFDALRGSVASTVLEDANPRGAIDACEAEILARLRRTPETEALREEVMSVLGRDDFSPGLDALAGTVRYYRIEDGRWDDLNRLYSALVDLRALATQDPNAGGSE